jgi:Holliday junction resolvasome RuvABC endonuclease subunit
MRVVGIDPGFRSIGAAKIEIVDGRVDVLRMEVLHTWPDDTGDVCASADDVRRAIEIFVALEEFIDDDVMQIRAEAMSYPRNATSAAKMKMCWGVIACISHARRIPILHATPMQIKQAVAGRRDASKVDMISAIVRRFPRLALRINDMVKKDREHPVDALSAALTFEAPHEAA